MNKYWDIEQKRQFEIFKNRPIILGRVINLDQLKELQCPVTLEGAKAVVAKPNLDLSQFGPLSLCFVNRILAHMIATTMLPRKGSLSSITSKDVFVLYYILKKYCIN